MREHVSFLSVPICGALLPNCMKTNREILASVFSLASLDESSAAALESVSVETVTAFIRYIYRELKNHPQADLWLQELVRYAGSSEFSLSQWLDQICCAYRWLEQQRRTARFFDVVEYVACAIEGSDLQPGHDLTWYLDHYGFEKAVEVPTEESKA